MGLLAFAAAADLDDELLWAVVDDLTGRDALVAEEDCLPFGFLVLEAAAGLLALPVGAWLAVACTGEGLRLVVYADLPGAFTVGVLRPAVLVVIRVFSGVVASAAFLTPGEVLLPVVFPEAGAVAGVPADRVAVVAFLVPACLVAFLRVAILFSFIEQFGTPRLGYVAIIEGAVQAAIATTASAPEVKFGGQHHIPLLVEIKINSFYQFLLQAISLLALRLCWATGWQAN